ncbi:hypothetical protein IFT69_18470 [Pseudomonas putida]|nr:hypothetical protein [Pseudomonas putida]
MAVVEITIKAKITKRFRLGKLLNYALAIAFLLIFSGSNGNRFLDCSITPNIDSQQAMASPGNRFLDYTLPWFCGLKDNRDSFADDQTSNSQPAGMKI